MLGEYLRIAAKALVAHKMRSGLTVLSITVGAFSIVLMSSLAQSGLATLARTVEELGGARIVLVASKEPERLHKKASSNLTGITRADRDLLRRVLPHVEEQAVFSSMDRKDVRNDAGQVVRADLVAADGDFFRTLRVPLGRGRFFTEQENRRHARVCVVTHELAEKLWDGDAVGRWASVGGTRCQVVGQVAKFERFGMNFGFEWERFVALPLETVGETEPGAEAGLLYLRTDSPASNDIVKRVANAILTERHHGVDDFQLWDFSKVMEQFYGIFAVMKAIVGLIAGIALLVGGVGVMNMMLVSVSERVREIGIRKALGASPRNIAGQFLCEAALLTTFGGAIGIGGGVAVAVLVNLGIHRLKPTWESAISTEAVLLALVVSVGVGLVFGFLPARRAGRLEAMEAIRR